MAEEKQIGDSKEYRLDPNTELRFEVEDNAIVTVELQKGLAEVFGAELTLNRKVIFVARSKVAVYTWQGCIVTLAGKTDVAYTVRETPMTIYVNTHAALEQLRVQAQTRDSRGPRIMMVGPPDVGKSTLCKLLVNYAARLGRSPILVDLDVGQNDISIPGTIGALAIERPSDIEEGYCLTAPLVYHFGHKTPEKNLILYNLLITQLAEVINMRCENNNKTNYSGVVVNTCGWVREGGYDAIVHAAGAFEVDSIVVLDQERLHSQLKRDMPEFVRVMLLPKSGGVVERSSKTRMDDRDNKIREYFYGTKSILYPHTFDVSLDEILVYKIGAPELPQSMMPLGQTSQSNRAKPFIVEPGPALLHHILAISNATSHEEDLVRTNIAGFIVVTAVDMDHRTLTVLSPSPRPLPRRILLLMEDIQFMDFK